MEKMREFYKHHYSDYVPLRYRMFCICTLLGTVTSFLGFVLCFIVNGFFNPLVYATGLGFLFMLVATIYGYKTKKIDLITVLMSSILNIIVFPSTFLVSGGLYSAAPMFFVMGIFIAVPLLTGKKRIVLFVLELIFYIVIISLCFYYPQLTYVRDQSTHTIMLLFSFIIVSFYIFSSTLMITRHYQLERMKSKKMNKLLHQQTIRDPLTQLYNRRYLTDFLVDKINGFEKSFTIIILDIDDFKRINDTYGHLFGDDVLSTFSHIMVDVIGDSGFVSRYGGEEFMIYYDNTYLNEIKDKLTNIKTQFSNHYSKYSDIHFTFSAGVTVYQDGQTLTQLFNLADKNLYLAKKNGKNQVVGFDS